MKISYNSPFILSYFFISLIVLLFGITITPGIMKYFSVYNSSFSSPGTYFRLFSHIIGHVDVMHFVGNFLLILIIGPLLEEKYGTTQILILTLIAACVTGLVHMLFTSSGALLGASGVVFAYILLSSFSSKQDSKIPLTLILVALLYMGKELYSIFTENDNISNSTHLLGGVIGIFAGFTIKPIKNKLTI